MLPPERLAVALTTPARRFDRTKEDLPMTDFSKATPERPVVIALSVTEAIALLDALDGVIDDPRLVDLYDRLNFQAHTMED